MQSHLSCSRKGEIKVVGTASAQEVECILFGFIPTWLVEGVAEAAESEDAVHRWLRAHGKFMKAWFWKRWRLFKGGGEGEGEGDGG